MTESAPKLTHAFEQALHRVAQHEREVGPKHRSDERTAMLEGYEAETVEALQQILGTHLAALELNPETRVLLDRLIDPTHQVELGALAGILIAIGYLTASAIMSGPMSGLTIASMRAFGEYAIPPGAVADGVARGRLDQGQAVDYFADSGVSVTKQKALVDMARSSLSAGEWMTLWQRGLTGDGDIDRNLAEAGLNDEAIVSLKRLREGPPSAAFAAQAVTQNQITMEQFEALLGMNGIDQSWGQAIYETEGQTMPPQMANELFRRGFIELPEYEQILLESNLKNKYVPLLKDLRWRVPPMRQTISAYHNGSIEREVAAGYLSKLGFDEDVQRWMLDSAAKASTSAGHHLSMQQHIAAYEAQLETAAQVHEALQAIGWSAADIDLEIDLADHRAMIARQSRAANAIGTRYVSWKISRNEASSALDALLLPTAARDEAMAAWDVQRSTRTAHFTRADIKKAHAEKLLSDAQAVDMWHSMGYDDEQVTILKVIDLGIK